MSAERLFGQPRLDERDAYRNFIESMRLAEQSARQLALCQNRMQWVLVANAIGAARDRAIEMAQGPTKPLIHRYVS